tara:strand:- start:3005 stop:3835 length:831 start_codon:yes stop_codon:yes gene_type:complete
MKTGHTILIGLPRSGTTWVHNYIRHNYINNNYGFVLPTVIKTVKGEIIDIGSIVGDEWFDVDRYRDTDRIQMLEACRQCGFEICHKVLVDGLARKYKDTNILNWFKEFYRDTNIIILKRKNLWKTYISYLFHSTISRQLEEKEAKLIHPWHAAFNTHTNTFVRANKEASILDETIKTNKINFKYDEKLWNEFMSSVRFLNNNVINELPNAEVIWTEDLSDKILEERFGGIPETTAKPFKNMNYEKYYSKKGLEFIKEKYYQVFRNEFINYGYISGI